MSMTVSMLVPLQTLFGWPAAPNPSPLAELGLLIGLPVAVIVIAFAVAKIGNAAKDRRTGGGILPSDPIWMGGQAKSVMGGPDNELTQIADVQREQLEAAPTQQEKAERSEARSDHPQIVGGDGGDEGETTSAHDFGSDSGSADATRTGASAGASTGASTGGAGARW